MSEPSSNPDSPPGNPTPEIPSPSDAAQGRYQRNERSREEPSSAPSGTKPDLPAPASAVETKADPYAPPQQDPTPPPPPPVVVGGNPTDKKLAAGLLGILLGGFGIHKFYLGYTQEGVIMLAVTLGVGIVGGALTCGLLTPFVIPMSVIGLIEGILYLTKTDEEFVATYVTGRKPWF